MTERTESTERTRPATGTETGNGAKGGAKTVETADRPPADDYADVFTPAAERVRRAERGETVRVEPGQSRGPDSGGHRGTAIVADQVTVAEKRPPFRPPGGSGTAPGGAGIAPGGPGPAPHGVPTGPPSGPGAAIGPPSGPGAVVGPPSGPGPAGPPGGPGAGAGPRPGGLGGHPGGLGVPSGAGPVPVPAAAAHGGAAAPPFGGYGSGVPGVPGGQGGLGGLGGGQGRPVGQPYPPAGARPAPSPPQPLGARSPRFPRKASLQIRRFDPWSVLKLSLVLSVAMFLMWLVAVGVLYGVLDGMGVWDKLNGAYSDLASVNESGGGGESLISAGRVFGVSAVVGVVNIVLFTAFATVAAFVYNVSADLAGGIEVTLSEHD